MTSPMTPPCPDPEGPSHEATALAPRTSSRRALLDLAGVAALAALGCDDAGEASGAGGGPPLGGPGGAGGAGTGGTAGSGATGGTGGAGGNGGLGGEGGAPLVDCVLTPEQMEGPFYLDADLVRSELSEGQPGAPLRLRVQVVSMLDACAPLAGVAVDLWHANAEGRYSGFPGQLGGVDTTGQTYCRGVQLTDAMGEVEMTTIYPGWYPGRAVHIHVKVHLDDATYVTSQLYFADAVSAEVYQTAPYVARGPADTPNAADSILKATPNGERLMVDVALVRGEWVGTLVIGVGAPRAS